MGAVHGRVAPLSEPVVGSVNDPLEAQAHHTAATGRLPPAPSGAAPAGATRAPRSVVAGLPALQSGGQPLAASESRPLGGTPSHDLADVRVHAGADADRVTGALDAVALTFGQHIVLSAAAAAADGTTRAGLLAHELTHVVQQRSSSRPPWIQRQPVGSAVRAPASTRLKAGDEIDLAVYGLVTDTTPERPYSGRVRVGASGSLVLGPPNANAVVPVAGLDVGTAAQRTADGLVAAQLFRGPRVCLTGPGMSSPVCANAKTAMPPDVARAHAAFMSYIATTREPVLAVARYHQWVSDNLGKPSFTVMKPWELWALSLKEPTRPVDPVAERTEVWLRFMKARQAETATLKGKDLELAVSALRAFQEWYDAHRATPSFATADPAKVYASLWIAQLRTRVDADVRAKLAADRAAAETSPAVMKAKGAKFDEFLATSMKLWGYSGRTFPYTIPLNSQGKDILVTGDPALQRVLDELGGALLRWASVHMSDPNYASVSVNAVLVDLLHGGFSVRIAEAQQHALEHETIDRNELLPRGVLASFGETVAKGLLVVAVVGLFVGAEVITLGQATWILVGVAGYSGVSAYSARRDEIEKSGYEVPVPGTMVHAAGDVVGVSQLVEGVTGQRLGTGAALGSEARSTQMGAGAGNVTTALIGSRAFKGGQSVGQGARLSRPGLKPSGPDANIPARPVPKRPSPPTQHPTMGPVETAARAALPEELRPGLDLWAAEMRANGGNPEVVLGRLPAARVRAQAQVFLDRYRAAVNEADVAAARAQRAKDDPLQPRLRHNVTVDARVSLHYENRPPGTHEIAQAVAIAKRTGEQVRLFGDTASGQNYPGIDGTIGTPPRALSLKAAVPAARANLARKMASDARQAAQDAGYTHVEVHIDMPGSTLAQVKAAWDAPPLVKTDPIPGPAFAGSVIAKIIVRASDGLWVQAPPLGPARTGVSPAPAQPDQDKR